MNDDSPALDALMSPTPAGGDAWSWRCPDGWQQGRGAFGGLVIGALVRAMRGAESDPARRVRSVTAEIAAPVLPGDATVHVETLRRGGALTVLRASLSQGDGCVAQAVAVLGASRAGGLSWRELEAPAMRPWREVEAAPYVEGMMPVFTRHVEFRPTGMLPFGGGGSAEVEGWVRLRGPRCARDASWLAALADAYWPAAFSRIDAARPMATVAFTLQVVGDAEGLDPDAPVYHRARCPVTDEGYCVESRELWGEDGRLLALNQQTFAVIR